MQVQNKSEEFENQIRERIKSFRKHDRSEEDNAPDYIREQFFGSSRGPFRNESLPSTIGVLDGEGNYIADLTPTDLDGLSDDDFLDVHRIQENNAIRIAQALNFVVGITYKDLKGLLDDGKTFVKYDEMMFDHIASLAVKVKVLQEQVNVLTTENNELKEALKETLETIHGIKKVPPVIPEWVKPKPAKKLKLKDVLPDND